MQPLPYHEADLLQTEVDLLQQEIDRQLGVPAYDTRTFVPRSALREYMQRDKIRKILRHCLLPIRKCEAILSDYLAVFGILLLIGKGPYINYFLQHNVLKDIRLPFENSDDWPNECRDCFSEFAEAQWRFCAQYLSSSSLNDARFSPNLILPLKLLETLQDGTDSTIYKVEIHPDYNQLIPKTQVANNATPPTYFVLKSCSTTRDELYKNEDQVYRALGHHNDLSDNVPRFYGSWRQGDKLNILLEFVDGGTLTNLFDQTHPMSEKDKVDFWIHLVEVLRPVCRLHFHHNAKHRNEVVSGVHQDIKPDNILVSRLRAGATFEFHFKLADFGLAYIPSDDRRNDGTKGRDLPGTPMYCAPECVRDEADLFDLRTVRPVHRRKDIWSLGCVFSEALVWSVLGTTGVNEYRQLRADATSEIPRLKHTSYSGCFHDGAKFSRAVREMHDRVREARSVINEIIPIIENLLHENVKQRLDARTARTNLRQTLKAARQILVDNLAQYPSHPSQNSPRQPFAASFTGGRRHVELHHSLQGQNSRPLPPREEERRHSTGPLDALKQSSLNRSMTDDQEETTSKGLPRFPHKAAQASQRMSAVHETTATEGAVENAVRPLDESSTDEPGTPVSKPSYHTLNGQPQETFPHATIDEVLDWIKEKKGSSTNLPEAPVSEFYLGSLRGTDQIFVIDNSRSMLQHKPDTRKTLEALSYLVKRLDPDGIDMYFTMSKETSRVHGTHRGKLLTRFDNADFIGQSSVSWTLSKILESKSKKRWWIFHMHRHMDKGKSVYVLTDGKWLASDKSSLCGVPELIERVVRRIEKREDLGIQFIQFGDDQVGTWRLRELDNGLVKTGVPMDVVDTERHDGNVYKMLLGHLISDWDDSTTAPITFTHPRMKVQSVNA